MSSKDSKAYIPLRRKTIRVGSSRWLRTPQFHVGNTNMLVSKNALRYPWPKAKAKIVVTPNASRWNIGGIGSLTRGAGVGHVDFILFTSYSLALGTQREPSFQWNTGLILILRVLSSKKQQQNSRMSHGILSLVKHLKHI